MNYNVSRTSKYTKYSVTALAAQFLYQHFLTSLTDAVVIHIGFDP